jgi:opacity protein-like surface antigen
MLSHGSFSTLLLSLFLGAADYARAEGPATLQQTTPIPAAGLAKARVGLPFEVSPTVGFMELGVEQVIGRTATLYPLTLNLVFDMALGTRAIPYGIVGGGLFLTVPLNTVGDQTISSAGLNFGGGMKYFITNAIGIRFETKQIFTRIDNKVDGRKELLIFQSTSLGVVFAFG